MNSHRHPPPSKPHCINRLIALFGFLVLVFSAILAFLLAGWSFDGGTEVTSKEIAHSFPWLFFWISWHGLLMPVGMFEKTSPYDVPTVCQLLIIFAALVCAILFAKKQNKRLMPACWDVLRVYVITVLATNFLAFVYVAFDWSY